MLLCSGDFNCNYFCYSKTVVVVSIASEIEVSLVWTLLAGTLSKSVDVVQLTCCTFLASFNLVRELDETLFFFCPLIPF